MIEDTVQENIELLNKKIADMNYNILIQYVKTIDKENAFDQMLMMSFCYLMKDVEDNLNQMEETKNINKKDLGMCLAKSLEKQSKSWYQILENL